MNKLSKEKRNQIIALVASVLAVCGLLWFFVVRPQNKSLDKLETDKEDAQTKIEKAQRMIKRRAAIEADLIELTNQIARVEGDMIPIEQLNGKKWLWDKLNHFIKDRHGVTVVNLSNDPLIGKQFLLLPKFDYSAAVYTVEMQAFFHEFGRFLADFENSFPHMRIQHLQMWPLATPLAATAAAADVPEELLNGEGREQLRILMKVVVLFKPSGPS